MGNRERRRGKEGGGGKREDSIRSQRRAGYRPLHAPAYLSPSLIRTATGCLRKTQYKRQNANKKKHERKKRRENRSWMDREQNQRAQRQPGTTLQAWTTQRGSCGDCSAGAGLATPARDHMKSQACGTARSAIPTLGGTHRRA